MFISRKPAGSQYLVEQLARFTNKRPSLQIFLPVGDLPNYEDTAIFISFAKNYILTRLRQIAFCAQAEPADLLFLLLPWEHLPFYYQDADFRF